jgi:hypothetical protein
MGDGVRRRTGRRPARERRVESSTWRRLRPARHIRLPDQRLGQLALCWPMRRQALEAPHCRAHARRHVMHGHCAERGVVGLDQHSRSIA